MGVCIRNMSSQEYINKITLLHQVGSSDYFMRKMHGQTILKKLRSSVNQQMVMKSIIGKRVIYVMQHVTRKTCTLNLIHSFSRQKYPVFIPFMCNDSLLVCCTRTTGND